MKTGRTLLRLCVYVGSVVAGSSPVGFVFVVNNQDSIRDKTISAGQNADFGGFLRSKAGSAGRFLVRSPFIGILTSSAARGTYAVERFAGAHPSHFVGPFSQGHGRPCLSIGTRATGSLLHGDLMQINGVNKGAFLHRLFHFIQLV